MLREYQHQHNLVPLQFSIWVLPLLGFIGTVVGITQAIAGLDKVLEVSRLATSGGLDKVLAGLRFAFDTTFVGLVLVIPTMLYTMPLRAKAQQLALLYHEVLLDRYFDRNGTTTESSR
jgi:biopolymer transport protein ExbB/TolQ